MIVCVSVCIYIYIYIYIHDYYIYNNYTYDNYTNDNYTYDNYTYDNYTYVYIYMYIHIYIYTHTYTYTCTYDITILTGSRFLIPTHPNVESEKLSARPTERCPSSLLRVLGSWPGALGVSGGGSHCRWLGDVPSQL